ncbi:DddA-like double-stranded DNA deaminase toxin [Amycolatopsis sp. VC5-11]|uniref:DddA-like double-stranded DNA deaminase toxin n=1 Tax=Amycolatopsis sp. VC5-11 TaxID=3120156 RepID=UPI003009D9F2
MAGVEEIIEGIGTVATKVTTGRSWLHRAGEAVDDAGQTLERATEGANAHEVVQALGLIAEAAAGITAADQLLGQVPARLDSYVASVRGGGETDDSSGSPPRQPTPPSNPKTGPDDPVERARRDLPPAVKRGRGAKTHGRLLTDDGQSKAVASGRDEWTDRVNQVAKEAGCPYTPMTAASDVELKVAAQMRDTGLRHATVVINNQPCTGRVSCDDLIGVVLPEGSSLTVHGTGGFKKTYQGGKRWV